MDLFQSRYSDISLSLRVRSVCRNSQQCRCRFLFSGNVHDRHKEIGNAVPPPLAAALGRMLRKQLDQKALAASEALLAEQLAT